MHVHRRVGSLAGVVSSDARIVLTAMVGVGSRQRQRSSILVTGVSCVHSIRIEKIQPPTGRDKRKTQSEDSVNFHTKIRLPATLHSYISV